MGRPEEAEVTLPLEPRNKVTFTRLPATEPVEIRFQDLQYRANLGFRKGKSIRQVSIRISGVRGGVTVNGRERDLDEFRRVSCYITQDDRLQPLLTVNENMKVAADLKLTARYTEKEKFAIIDEILKMLGLYESKPTRAAQLSGGQKKRLSIALELVNNPLVMFLDEPTTGLDSASCLLCIQLMRVLAEQGRTIVCTIHQPSASLFQNFDHVYILAEGQCLYQGSANSLVPYLESVNLPCPMYHNPADYVIELACGEYGRDKIETLVQGTQNGRSIRWFKDADLLPPTSHVEVSHKSPRLPGRIRCYTSLQDTTQFHQLSVIIKRGFIKVKRDSTLTYMRIYANILTGLMLGTLYYNSGVDGSTVLDNYNLLFSIIIHHAMSTMMLTILTSLQPGVGLGFPDNIGPVLSAQRSPPPVRYTEILDSPGPFPHPESNVILSFCYHTYFQAEFFFAFLTQPFNSPCSYEADNAICCILFSVIVYLLSGQPLDDMDRFWVFLTVSLLVVFIAQSIGYVVGAIFNSVVNGTFAGPILIVPMMMFSGFGVNFRDIPGYLRWGTYVSYLRYSLEGYVGAIYGMNRTTLPCDGFYCHYRYPEKFLYDIAMKGDVYNDCIIILVIMLLLVKFAAYILLRWKIRSLR
ncbi:unnamed protein product [Nezara viridula]|uniref:ABC transporter domain-containing protein n=1 Tax=Nezara viridula TaxID=85310 RepID=A0A9P0MY04_NEZVI|nr:unnamed protein product [Nezara viridula]